MPPSLKVGDGWTYRELMSTTEERRESCSPPCDIMENVVTQTSFGAGTGYEGHTMAPYAEGVPDPVGSRYVFTEWVNRSRGRRMDGCMHGWVHGWMDG